MIFAGPKKWQGRAGSPKHYADFPDSERQAKGEHGPLALVLHLCSGLNLELVQRNIFLVGST